MVAYVIADTEIHDHKTYGELNYNPVWHMAAIKAWYRSPEYAPLLAMRQPAAIDHLVAVEGT